MGALDALDALVDDVLRDTDADLGLGHETTKGAELATQGYKDRDDFRFNRIHTATPAETNQGIRNGSNIRGTGVLPRSDGTARDSDEDSSSGDWVDDCLREAEEALRDLESGQNSSSVLANRPAATTLHHRDGSGVRSGSAGHRGAERIPSSDSKHHIDLFHRLALWEERKKMSHMLGVYEKLIAEQAECTFRPAINSGRRSTAASTEPSDKISSSPARSSYVRPSSACGRSDDAALVTQVKGLDSFLQRMAAGRDEREWPQREEQARLARYRDPSTFRRHPTKPKPFSFSTSSTAYQGRVSAASGRTGGESDEDSRAPPKPVGVTIQPLSRLQPPLNALLPLPASAAALPSGVGTARRPTQSNTAGVSKPRLVTTPREGSIAGSCHSSEHPRDHMEASPTPPTTNYFSSMEVYRSIGAALREDLFAPEFSQRLQQARCPTR